MNPSYLFIGRTNLLTVIKYISQDLTLLDFATKPIHDLYVPLATKYPLNLYDLFQNFIYQQNYIILVVFIDNNIKLYPLFQDINGNYDNYRIVPKNILRKYDKKIHINDHQVIIPLFNPTQTTINLFIKPEQYNSSINKSLDNIHNISTLSLNSSDDFDNIITQISKINFSKPFVTDNYYKYWSTRIYKYLDTNEPLNTDEYTIDSTNCINYIDSSVTIPTQYKASYTIPDNFIKQNTIENIIKLFKYPSPIIDNTNLVKLYCIMAVSKEFCHLTINNAHIINTIFRKILKYNKHFKSIRKASYLPESK